MQIGNLYLVPNTLGSDNRAAQIHHVVPTENLRLIAKIKYWIVEDAKTSRAFLNAVHEIEPLRHSLQEMVMQEWRGPDRKNSLSLKPEELLPFKQGTMWAYYQKQAFQELLIRAQRLSKSHISGGSK